MPLASLFTLQWYGPASGTAILDEATGSTTATLGGWAQPDASILAEASVPMADATRLRNSPASIFAEAAVLDASPKARARPTARIDVASVPTADDVAQAVWGSATTINAVEGTMAVALRMVEALLRNRMVTDPATGVVTVYDENDVALATADLWEDAAGTAAYDGNGAERRDRFA
jgi:hypothetical protein